VAQAMASGEISILDLIMQKIQSVKMKSELYFFFCAALEVWERMEKKPKLMTF